MSRSLVSKGFKDIREYWDWVAENSFHLRQTKPTVTDIHYRHLVLSRIRHLSSTNHRRILKLDAYNEATNTQYGFHLLRQAEELALVDVSAGILKRARSRAEQKRSTTDCI